MSGSYNTRKAFVSTQTQGVSQCPGLFGFLISNPRPANYRKVYDQIKKAGRQCARKPSHQNRRPHGPAPASQGRCFAAPTRPPRRGTLPKPRESGNDQTPSSSSRPPALRLLCRRRTRMLGKFAGPIKAPKRCSKTYSRWRAHSGDAKRGNAL